MASSSANAKAPEAHFSAGGTGAGIYFKAPPVFCAPPASKEDPALETSNCFDELIAMCLPLHLAHSHCRARTHHKDSEMPSLQPSNRSHGCFRTNEHCL
jgi:hypothetical protein